jgi:hypothetical protein
MTSFRGQASWVKMMSPGGKLTALVCHPTKKVNKTKELTHLSTNIGQYVMRLFQPLNSLVVDRNLWLILLCKI